MQRDWLCAGSWRRFPNHLSVTFKLYFLNLFGWSTISTLQEACYSWRQKVYVFLICVIQKKRFAQMTAIGLPFDSFAPIRCHLSLPEGCVGLIDAQRILPCSNNWPITHLYWKAVVPPHAILFFNKAQVQFTTAWNHICMESSSNHFQSCTRFKIVFTTQHTERSASPIIT